jgi:hypothetical protein
MNAESDTGLIRSISGDTEIAAPSSIAAPGALYAVDFSDGEAKKRESELLAPFGRETALRGDLDEDQREGKFLTADSSSRPY